MSRSTEALRVAERGYQEGAADYLSVLTAQRNLLASQTSLNGSATGATLTVVNLYKSLGGGWNPARGRSSRARHRPRPGHDHPRSCPAATSAVPAVPAAAARPRNARWPDCSASSWPR